MAKPTIVQKIEAINKAAGSTIEISSTKASKRYRWFLYSVEKKSLFSVTGRHGWQFNKTFSGLIDQAYSKIKL